MRSLCPLSQCFPIPFAEIIALLFSRIPLFQRTTTNTCLIHGPHQDPYCGVSDTVQVQKVLLPYSRTKPLLGVHRSTSSHLLVLTSEVREKARYINSYAGKELDIFTERRFSFKHFLFAQARPF